MFDKKLEHHNAGSLDAQWSSNMNRDLERLALSQMTKLQTNQVLPSPQSEPQLKWQAKLNKTNLSLLIEGIKRL
ncbi:MAG: hypothetical protein AAF629_20270 [Chloroflexota bacterium]